MNVLDLCSGIGGFSLGLERAGMNTVAFCEIEPFCQKILNQHWPDVPIFSDLRELTHEQIERPIDLICGGYPCQPFSVAGKRRGKDDSRHLWPEFSRLIREIRPNWVLFENVTGHITMGIDDVFADLENQNYTTQAFIIPACAVDAPHRRNRVWILGYSHSELIQRLRPNRKQKLQPHAKERSSLCTSEMPRATQWETEPQLGRVVDGIPNRLDRVKALGNAIIPRIAEIFGHVIMQANNLVE